MTSSSVTTGAAADSDDDHEERNQPRTRGRRDRRSHRIRKPENDQSDASTSTSTSRSYTQRSHRSTSQYGDKYDDTRHLIRSISTGTSTNNPSTGMYRRTSSNVGNHSLASSGSNSNIFIHAGVYPNLSPSNNPRASITVANRWNLPSSSSNNLLANEGNRSRADTNVSNTLIPRTISRSNRAISDSLGLSLEETVGSIHPESIAGEISKTITPRHYRGSWKQRRYITKGMKRRYQLLNSDPSLGLPNNYRASLPLSNGTINPPSGNVPENTKIPTLVHSVSTFNLGSSTTVPVPPSLRITQPTLRASPSSLGTPRSSVRPRPRIPSSDIKGDINGRSRAGTQTTLSYISTPSRRQSLAASLSGVYPTVNNPVATPLPSMPGVGSFQNLNSLLLPSSTVPNRFGSRLRAGSTNITGIGSLNNSLVNNGGLPTVSGGLTDTMNTNFVRTPINRRNSVARRTNMNPSSTLAGRSDTGFVSPTSHIRTMLHQAWNIDTLNWNDLLSVMGNMYLKYPPTVPLTYLDIDYSRYLEDDDDGIIDHSLIATEELEPYQNPTTLPLGFDFPTKTVIGTHLIEGDAEWLRSQLRNAPPSSGTNGTTNTNGGKKNSNTVTEASSTSKTNAADGTKTSAMITTDLGSAKLTGTGTNPFILSTIRPPTLDENISLRIANMVNHIAVSRSLRLPLQGSLLHTILLQQYMQAIRRYRLNGCTSGAALAARKPGGSRPGYAPIASITGHGIPRRLFEYYVVVGRGDILPDIDIPSTVDVDDLEFSPVIYERFPGEDWSGGKTLPNNIGIFAFPFGIRITKDAPPVSSTFDFVLTGEDGAKLFCTCIIRWELMEALDAVSMFAVGSSTSGATMNMNSMLNTINKHSLLLPDWFDLSTVADPNWNKKYRYYSPKAHILMSSQPLFGAMHTTLTQLVRLTLASASNPTTNANGTKSIASTENASASPLLPMDAYISYVLHDVPLPPRGYASVGFTLGDRHIIVSRPPINQLPLLDVPLETLFQCLDINNILTVFTALLCERRIALCSKYVHLLTPVAEALISLLFPFRWVVNYIPVLPFDMAEIIGAPTPYLLGWCGTVEEAQAYSAETVFVGLDTNIVHVPSFTPLPKLPEASRRKLVRALQMYAYGSTGGVTNPTGSRGGVFASLGFSNSTSSASGTNNNRGTGNSTNTTNGTNTGTTNNNSSSSSSSQTTFQIAYGADMNNDLQNRMQNLTVLPSSSTESSSVTENKLSLAIGNNLSPLVPLSLFLSNDAQKKGGNSTSPLSSAATVLCPGSIQFRLATPLWSHLRTSHLFTGSIDLHRLLGTVSTAYQNNSSLVNQLNGIVHNATNNKHNPTNLFPFALGWHWKYDTNQLNILNNHIVNALLDDERGNATITTATGNVTNNPYSSGGSGDEGHTGTNNSSNRNNKNTKGTIMTSSNNGNGKPGSGSPTTPPSIGTDTFVPLSLDIDISMEHGIPWDPSNTVGHANGTGKSFSSASSGASFSASPNTTATNETSDSSVTNTSTGLSNRFDATGIRLSFLNFFVTLLKDYNKYVTYTKINTQAPDVTAIHLHRIVTSHRRQHVFATNNHSNASASVPSPKVPGFTGSGATGISTVYEYLNTSTISTTGTRSDGTITGAIFTTPLPVSQLSPLETTIDTLKRIGIPIPPLPLPLLSVTFDKDSFILDHSVSRDLCRQFMSTQLFQVFEQSLLPLCYRPSSLAQIGTQFTTNPSTSTVTTVPPTVWNPDEQDPHFYQRLTPSVRLFNTAVNAKLNQTAASSRLTFTRTTNKVRFDTSFLTDTSMLIKHHITVSPPVPLIVSTDLSLALTTLRQAPESMTNGMDKSLVSPSFGPGTSSVSSPVALLAGSSTFPSARAPQSGMRLYTSPLSNTGMNSSINNGSTLLTNVLLSTPSRRRGVSSVSSLTNVVSSLPNSTVQPNRLVGNTSTITTNNAGTNDNGTTAQATNNNHRNGKPTVHHHGGRHRYLAQQQKQKSKK